MAAAEFIERLPRRLAAAGAPTLSDADLVALVVGAERRRGIEQLLVERGGAHGLARAGVPELAAVAELGTEAACRIKAALELGRRALDEPLDLDAPIRSAADVDRHLRGRLVGLEQEELHVLGLDSQACVAIHSVAAVGTMNCVFASPRDVFRPLIRDGANRAILIHNHPSGSPTPSPEDFKLTDRMLEAGALVGVELVDHVVMARRGHYSFAEHGRIPVGPVLVCRK